MVPLHHKPVVVDETFHIAMAVKYGLFSVWGAVSYFFGLRTIGLVSGTVAPWYETVWALSVAVLSALLIAPIFAKLERFEAWLTVLWVGLVSVYPLCSAYLWAQGDTNRAALTILGLSVLAIPVWRFTFLIRKNLKKHG